MLLEIKEMDKLVAAKITEHEANLNNAEQFKEEIFALIDNGHLRIIISFEKVNYVDSSFLGAMVSCLKHALSKGGDIYLADLQKDIYSLLVLIRMDKVFKIYKTEEEGASSI